MNQHQIKAHIENKLKENKFVYITIEGNIGAGKTRFLTKIQDKIEFAKKNQTCLVLQEPVEIWEKTNLLKMYYLDPKKNALNFQLAAFCTTLLTLKNSLKTAFSSPSPIVIFGERSPLACVKCFTPLLIEQGKINPQNEYYIEFRKIFEEILPYIYPDVIFYLNDSNTTTLLKRIKKRNRPGEENITLDYLQHLEKKYDQMMNEISQKKTTIIIHENNEKLIDEIIDLF